MSASASDTEPAGLAAMRRLGALLAGDVAGESWLWLQVRLRAASDALVSAEHDACARDAVLLGCQAFQEFVMRGVDARAGSNQPPLEPSALLELQRRSSRYLCLAASAPARMVRSSSELLASLLWAGAGGVGGGPSTPCVLTHGGCRHVTTLLLHAARQQPHLTVLVAEGSPAGGGHATAAALLAAGVPVRMIEPAAVSRCMPQVRLVLCGAHAILEDGGVLGDVGTLTMAYAAMAHGRPFYAAAPHYAFCRKHHLDAAAQTAVRAAPAPNAGRRRILVERPVRDATPPSLVTLLFTDVGVLTPSAVADELLRVVS